jgi:hypothetical protein
VLETPELGRLDDEHVCGHLADAWNFRQDVEPLAQVRICVAQCFEVTPGSLGTTISRLLSDSTAGAASCGPSDYWLTGRVLLTGFTRLYKLWLWWGQLRLRSKLLRRARRCDLT